MDILKPESTWYMSAFVFGQKPEKVDREQGILSGVYVCTEGEALGHGVMLDGEFISNVVRLGNEKKQGLKARFGHPNMSSTALGTFLGRVKNLREGKTPDGKAAAIGDLFLSNSAKEAPGGNLHEYTLKLAEEDSKAFGMSIVFKRGKEYKRDEKGAKVYEFSAPEDFKPFVEIEDLMASDLVDNPAANPDGIFSSFNEATMAGQVSEFLDLHPQVFALAVKNPDMIERFMKRYDEYKKLSNTGDKKMSAESNIVAESAKIEEAKPEVKQEVIAAAVAPVVETVKLSEPAVIVPVVEEAAKVEPAVEVVLSVKPSELDQMVKEFGNEIAVKALCSGGGYDKAKELHYEALKAENKQLKLGKVEGVKPAAAGVEPKETRTIIDLFKKSTK